MLSRNHRTFSFRFVRDIVLLPSFAISMAIIKVPISFLPALAKFGYEKDILLSLCFENELSV